MVDGGVVAMTERIRDRLDAEIADARRAAPDSWQSRTLGDFLADLQEPKKVGVNFSGGAVLDCWMVTRDTGPYSVVYLPDRDVFSLAVASVFGPVDISVHGPALSCYGSVY
ncbi:hypothetical protein JQU17_17170 [Ponticoccus sp. SC2-23]|uniref:hypothetical protein n=1 Tax=Alexandriicola marinus TaxID=2081710 RepID=UPI000FD9E959|nr:hypothetical protein [Alexandriicola marinus]MBM1222173.1 hypothetical protein [Ponticoccus sp. SC6-9]MBM1226860.1 hypothetical protein [Ponticoccus sp. SC6-15]MBM1231120.1 hypothetical protein [Ponticoccus sp. SC6-38]MBM1235628.1 hypothetical protein [Ponticoccus sp. SC6-45]MBM1240142.1 hypothetical protein [Ponticoccus sp. SC6-49]MBM1244496.1 hypothetical protein [Ponticoccus sp. SC2-64]MBM1249102.1 hypothetical protein [Ponticoccus sp. SC6-42]MBM1253797.1 hypothetical protein [Pontico